MPCPNLPTLPCVGHPICQCQCQWWEINVRTQFHISQIPRQTYDHSGPQLAPDPGPTAHAVSASRSRRSAGQSANHCWEISWRSARGLRENLATIFFVRCNKKPKDRILSNENCRFAGQFMACVAIPGVVVVVAHLQTAVLRLSVFTPLARVLPVRQADIQTQPELLQIHHVTRENYKGTQSFAQ